MVRIPHTTNSWAKIRKDGVLMGTAPTTANISLGENQISSTNPF